MNEKPQFPPIELPFDPSEFISALFGNRFAISVLAIVVGVIVLRVFGRSAWRLARLLMGYPDVF